MNRLIVGRDKTTILEHLPDPFLLIDDGEIIDALPIPQRRKVIHFDVTTHSFDPFKNLDYLRARQFIEILNAVFPEGENTLTKKNSSFVLLKALLSKPSNLKNLIPKATKETLDAYQKIQTLLLSPVLKRVLCGTRDFIIDDSRTLIVRLNRAELGDFDCFVLANLLIGQYTGQVILPDFGFYGCPFHAQLIRQNRLIAGVNYLSESELEKDLLLIEEKIASRCLAKDAEVLAQYRGLLPHTVDYNDFIADSIR